MLSIRFDIKDFLFLRFFLRFFSLLCFASFAKQRSEKKQSEEKSKERNEEAVSKIFDNL